MHRAGQEDIAFTSGRPDTIGHGAIAASAAFTSCAGQRHRRSRGTAVRRTYEAAPARGEMVVRQRAEARGPDGEIPGDAAQASDD